MFEGRSPAACDVCLIKIGVRVEIHESVEDVRSLRRAEILAKFVKLSSRQSNPDRVGTWRLNSLELYNKGLLVLERGVEIQLVFFAGSREGTV
jgi:hypothetical protein